MAGSDASAYLSAVKWGDEGYYFKEFTQKFALPQVAKIIKGQYLNLGVPSLPSPSLNQIVFLASAGKRIKLAAQCVRFKEGRRVVPVGPKLAIPDNYEGWFEILSEDGRAVRCIESVAELAKRFPETCLVRENIKGYVCKSDDADSMTEKTRTISAGETLVLLSEVLGAPIRSKSSSGRFLRCFTSKGETVFLSLDQRGKFSPIAGEENISGVHSIKNLLTKRFPLMVRLVHGKPPMGLKSSSQFTSEMRLYSLFEEECIMALPLLKDSNIVALPLTAPLKLQAPKNADVLVKLREYSRLTEKCKMMMMDISDRIQVFDITLSKELRNELKGNGGNNFLPSQRHRRNHPLLIKRSISDPQTNGCKNGVPPVVLDRENSAPAGEVLDITKPDTNDRCYDEIDQIYDYVRGFAPLPDKIKSDFTDEDEEEVAPSSSPTASVPMTTPVSPSAPSHSPIDVEDEGKPEPPPIETIPVRKLSLGVVEPVSSVTPMPQKITVSIINRTPPRSKDLSAFERESMHEHIYEKVGRRSSEADMKHNGPVIDSHVRKPVRSNSAGKIYFPNTANLISNGNKLFIKSPAQQRNSHKPRLYRSSKSSPMLKDAPLQKTTRTNKTCRSSRSLTTSPLFNIRYKSLTNLAVDFNTLDSSNSGGQTSSGSGGSKDCKELRRKTPRLLRPKSLTNLFWDANHVENCNKYNLLQNELNCRADIRKNGMLHEIATNGKPVNSQSKRIGTLYL